MPELLATHEGTDAAMTNLQDAPIRCEVLEGIVAIRNAHDALAELAELPGAASSIVQHPDWLHFELESRGTTVAPYVVVARNSEGQILGYAPFLVGHHPARITLGSHSVTLYRGRTLRLLGARAVAQPLDRAQVEAAIAQALARDQMIKVVHIQETVLPNTLARALVDAGGGFKSVPFNLLDQINWSIAPQPSLASYISVIGPRRKKLNYALRSVYKKLGSEAQLRVFEATEQIDEYCRLMNQLYAKSWHATTHNIDWELPTRKTLFTQLARQRRIVGHMLMLGSQPIAYVHGYRLGGRYLLDDTGYDEAFSALGVGSALVFQAVQDLVERHPDEIIDFGYGDNVYKRVLATDETPCGALYLVRGPVARSCFWLIAPIRAFYLWQRSRRERTRTANARATP